MNGTHPGMRAASTRWTLNYHRARAHARIVSAIFWATVVIATFATPGIRNLANHLKGEDFVQIYTLAHAAFEGHYPTLRTYSTFHARQVELVPESAPERYLPVYPPTAAMMFRPFAALSYGWAALAWAALSIAVYGLVVWGSWRPERDLLADRSFVVAAGAAFPPFILLILYGQTTTIPLAAFFLAWAALRAGRPFIAGLALGLLSVKPQFAIAICLVLALTTSWRILLGMGLAVLAQVSLVAWMLGIQALEAYLETVRGIRSVEYLLEPSGWRMHSIRTLTRLIPEPAGELLWGVSSLILIVLAARVWRSRAPVGPRFGILVIASVLVNPHLFAYDAVVLVLPFIWIGGWIERTLPPMRRAFWQAVYGIAALILLPTAFVIYVQLSVILLLWLFWRLGQEMLATDSVAQPQEAIC